MAKERMINTRFWNDTWVRKINPLDRYLFLYLLTNEHTNIAGIYELPIQTMAFESGLDERDLQKTMLPHLKPKVYYKNGWVIMTNFPRYQNTTSESVIMGIKRELGGVPKDVLDYAIGGGYGEGMGGVGGLSNILNLTKLNLTRLNGDPSSFNKKKKPFFRGEEMRKSKGRWWVLPKDGGDWLEFAGLESEIEWK